MIPRPFRLVLLLYGVAIALFVAGAALHLDALRIVAKPLPVLLLAVGVARSAEAGTFRTRLVFGLVLCAAGDLILELGRFVPGLVAFLVGHLGYVAAFTAEAREPRPLRALPFAAFGAVVVSLLWNGLGPMAIPVALYTTAICTMMWRASALVSRERPWATPVLAGAIIFAASDTMIAVNRFHAPFPAARVLILSTYWLAQALVAGGAVARARDVGGATVRTRTTFRA